MERAVVNEVSMVPARPRAVRAGGARARRLHSAGLECVLFKCVERLPIRMRRLRCCRSWILCAHYVDF
jgi:hypothetical protein